MGEPSTYELSNTDSQHKCYLFQQPGYILNGEQRIRMGEYVWSISPYKCEKDGKLGIDILISVQGIEPNTNLLAEFSLHQPGNEKHTFEHAFDCYRSTFFYRRALTIPTVGEKNGMSSAFYSYYRFLRSRHDDEPDCCTGAIVSAEISEWKPRIPLQWDLYGEAPVYRDTNDVFLETINALEEYKMTFMYYFTVESAQKSTYIPYRPSTVWPKASITGRYLHGKSISVDETWFTTWPTFKKFMKNLDLLTPEDFEDFTDILGVYYHSWNVEHHRLVELIRAAEKFGFYDFPQAYLLVGNVHAYFCSMRSVLFAPSDHPLFTTDMEVMSKLVHEEVFAICYENVPREEYLDPLIHKCFKTKNGMELSVNVYRKTFSNVDYLCITLMFNGAYRTGEHQLWKVIVAPSKHSSLAKLPRRVHTRVLNSVQRTICFPTCWRWNDVMKEMGQTGTFVFTVRTALTSLTAWRFDEVATKHAVTGVTNAEIMCKDGTIIAVNKDFLQASCGIFSQWIPMPNKEKRMQVKELEFLETLHFLDHLYHLSKLYTTEIWSQVMKVAQVTNCDTVVDSFERALIRTETTKISDEKFNDDYSLDYLKFNVEMRESLGIQPLDDFLEVNCEPAVKCFDNE